MTVAVGSEHLAQAIIESYDAQVAAVAAIREATGEQLNECDRSREAMAQEQRTRLLAHHADLRAGGDDRRAEFRKAHAAMARREHADLAKAEAARAKAEAARVSSFRAWMSPVRGAHAQARATWENLNATMRERRARGSTHAAAVQTAGHDTAGSAARTTAKRAGRERKIFAKLSGR